MQVNPNKKYKDLKQKQKAKICDWMFREVCEFYRIYNRMPSDKELNILADIVYIKIKGAAIWVSYDEFLVIFQKKLIRFHERILTAGLPEIQEKKPKQPTGKKPRKKKKSKSLFSIFFRTSFRQILPLTASKILAIRQYSYGFFPC